MFAICTQGDVDHGSYDFQLLQPLQPTTFGGSASP